MARTRIVSRATGIYGLVISPVIFIVVGSGHVQLDVHGFGAVVLLQGIWLIATGAALYRAGSAAM
jgi:hypothetical protein